MILEQIKANIPSGTPGKLSNTSAAAVDARREITASDKVPLFKSEASITSSYRDRMTDALTLNSQPNSA